MSVLIWNFYFGPEEKLALYRPYVHQGRRGKYMVLMAWCSFTMCECCNNNRKDQCNILSYDGKYPCPKTSLLLWLCFHPAYNIGPLWVPLCSGARPGKPTYQHPNSQISLFTMRRSDLCCDGLYYWLLVFYSPLLFTPDVRKQILLSTWPKHLWLTLNALPMIGFVSLWLTEGFGEAQQSVPVCC